MPDSGIITKDQYVSQPKFTNNNTIVASDDSRSRIELHLGDAKAPPAQNSAPVAFDPHLFKSTDAYKETLRILNSIK